LKLLNINSGLKIAPKIPNGRVAMMKRVSLGLCSAAFAVWTSMASATPLVINGGFETGDFTGWTASPDGTVGIDSLSPNTGKYDAFFSTIPGVLPGPGMLSQPITTTPGQSYDLLFALVDQSGFALDTMSVSFGGFSQLITGDQAAPPGDTPAGYTSFSIPISGTLITTALTTLEFDGTTSDSSEWNLDDVEIDPVGATGVPEPSSLLMLGAGLMTLAWGWRVRQRSQPS
jgi:hypothetical protein